MLDFILNVLRYIVFLVLCCLVSLALDYPILFIPLLFILVLAIIIKRRKDNKNARLVLEDLSAARKGIEVRGATTEVPEDMICINCGAPLRAKYAICDYCDTRSRMNADNTMPD